MQVKRPTIPRRRERESEIKRRYKSPLTTTRHCEMVEHRDRITERVVRRSTTNMCFLATIAVLGRGRRCAHPRLAQDHRTRSRMSRLWPPDRARAERARVDSAFASRTLLAVVLACRAPEVLAGYLMKTLGTKQWKPLEVVDPVLVRGRVTQRGWRRQSSTIPRTTQERQLAVNERKG